MGSPGGVTLARIAIGVVRTTLRSHALWLTVGYVSLLLLMARAYS
jgi:hypothetical protein